MFAELDSLQRAMQSAFDLSPSIRGFGRGGFPALNMGTTPQSVELFAFAPGLDPASIDVNLEHGLLTLAGRRETDLPDGDEQKKANDGATVYINERFSGSFSRAISLPDDVDADAVSADYKNGVLHVSVKRKESARPRRISVNA
jgi:HSP20 family protein